MTKVVRCAVLNLACEDSNVRTEPARHFRLVLIQTGDDSVTQLPRYTQTQLLYVYLSLCQASNLL